MQPYRHKSKYYNKGKVSALTLISLTLLIVINSNK